MTRAILPRVEVVAPIAGAAALLCFGFTLVSALRARWRSIAALAASVCVVAGCAGGGAVSPTSDGQATAGHDEVGVEGARELDSALTKLVLVDQRTGETSVYDTGDDSETPIGSFGPVSEVHGDGRFAYLAATQRTTVVDAGAWTFDHGEHYHYFASSPAVAATLGVAATGVSASNSIAAVQPHSGATTLIDREQLGRRAVVQPHGLTPAPDAVAAVPYGNRLVTAHRSGRIQVVDDSGANDLAGDCPKVSWAMPTRRAVVFGCDTGAVRVTGGDGDLTVTPAPFPNGAPRQRPGRMEHRNRSDVFAGLAAGTVWVLDSRQRSWTLLPVPDAVAVNTAGDGTVLVLHRDGTLGVFDVAESAEVARVSLFDNAIPEDGPQPVIDIDSDRAYVNNAGAREIYEIDYAEGLRISRTLRTGVAPVFMVGAGR